MNIQIRHYDRILLLYLDGPVAEPDLVQVAGFINTLASRIGVVVFDVHKAQVEPSVAATVLRLKKQYEKGKLKFLVVSPELIGADSGTLAGALDSIGSAESDRVTELFALDAELLQLQQQTAKNRAQLAQALALPAGAEPAGATELGAARHALAEKNQQLRQLFKTLSSEIHLLETDGEKTAMPGADNPTAVRVGEAKRVAIGVVKSTQAME